MTIQNQILTRSSAAIDDDGSVIVNPFYQCSGEFMETHIAEAKIFYPKVFKFFLWAWTKRS